MKKLKKLLISCISVLGISFLVWTVLLLNPNLSYANKTQIENITVFHNSALEEGIDLILKDAVAILKTSDIYDQNLDIQLCLNDDKIYPNLHPFAGGTAYAFANKTIIYASQANFKDNYAEFSWAINNYEFRKYNLTALLAHEFTHNLQFNFDSGYYNLNSIRKINWKLEGYAEYISREFKHDGKLKEKIQLYLKKEQEEYTGVPVFILSDGTIQNLSYFKYALVVQYLMEEKNLSFAQICAMKQDLDSNYSEMIAYYKE